MNCFLRTNQKLHNIRFIHNLNTDILSHHEFNNFQKLRNILIEEWMSEAVVVAVADDEEKWEI